jgi:hypothetical protein
MAHPREYTLQIVCPHCGRIHAITEYPVTAQEPFAFTCQVKRGGCGGHAFVQPPDLTHFPNLAVYIVGAPKPLTPAEYQWYTEHFAQP